jgi:phosphotransferase system enzyme I (PtsI)
MAVVVAHAHRGSHASLLTTGRGIPAVGQLPEVLTHVSEGDTVLVDGVSGKVVIRPDDASRRRFEQRVERERNSVQSVSYRRDERPCTRDGTEVQVVANVGSREETLLAAENGAAGIGLFRLEFLLMSFDELPTEATLADRLRWALEPLGESPITIRLLDAGGDKPMPWLPLPKGRNPALGVRGVRLLLSHPDLLEYQLRVLIRISQQFHDLRILIPLVTLSEEIRGIRDHAWRVADQLGVERVPSLGAMIETPAAALCVDEIKTDVEFLSLGTNDLTQYTMAADRENADVAHYFQDQHPAVMKLVRIVCEQAGDRPLWVCGELAGRVDAIPTLLRLGVRNLSVAPPLIPSVKEAIRGSSV